MSTLPAAHAAPRGRASWSGLMRLSLVAVPVKAYPAVATSESIQLNQLHRECRQRIRYERVCPLHGKVDSDQIVKGYQYAPDQYVLIEPEELEHLRPAKDKALILEQFIHPDEVNPARFSGRTLYLLPDGLAAHRPYRVLAEALEQRGRWAMGRVVMSGHRYGVVVRSVNDLLSTHFLHEPAQVRSAAAFAAQLRAEPVSPAELQLATTLIDGASGPVDFDAFRDDTAVQLERLVEAKVAGREAPGPEGEEPVQVIELLTALKQSVAAAQGKGGQPSRSASRKSKRRSA
jgi:DNA end-binding protein Ku